MADLEFGEAMQGFRRRCDGAVLARGGDERRGDLGLGSLGSLSWEGSHTPWIDSRRAGRI